MLRKALLAACILVAGPFVAAPVFGWDDTGHQITAYIAWTRMTPEVRERVHKILLEAPEDSDIATFFPTYGIRSEATRKREYFMFMATWADVIRDRKFENRYKNYHRSNWHYYDKFWKRVNGKIEYLPAPEDGGQALAKLQEFDAMIRGRVNDSQKAVAIAWLMHIIGDIHQPLHTSARVTDLEPKGDMGGNLVLLTPQGTPRDQQLNLHWYWDSIVPRNEPNSADKCETDYVEPIAERFMKKYPFSRMQGQLALGKYEEWTEQSLKLAQDVVFSAELVRFQTPSESYKKKAFELAEERMTLAGYRMGELFNQVFGPSPAAPAGAPN